MTKIVPSLFLAALLGTTLAPVAFADEQKMADEVQQDDDKEETKEAN